jgi:Flp pilus assembly protein TadG
LRRSFRSKGENGPARASLCGAWKGRSRLRDESGQSVVEFGLVVPLLCTLVLVLVDFGKFMNYWLDLTHVANFGARLAAVDTDLSKSPYNSGLSMQQFIQQQAETSELRGATVSICFPTADQTPGAPVRVQVAYDYKFIPFISRTITLKGKATMRLEHQATHFSGGSC